MHFLCPECPALMPSIKRSIWSCSENLILWWAPEFPENILLRKFCDKPAKKGFSFILFRVYAPWSQKVQSLGALSAQTVWKKSCLLMSRHHKNCERRFKRVLNGGLWISGWKNTPAVFGCVDIRVKTLTTCCRRRTAVFILRLPILIREKTTKRCCKPGIRQQTFPYSNGSRSKSWTFWKKKFKCCF